MIDTSDEREEFPADDPQDFGPCCAFVSGVMLGGAVVLSTKEQKND